MFRNSSSLVWCMLAFFTLVGCSPQKEAVQDTSVGPTRDQPPTDDKALTKSSTETEGSAGSDGQSTTAAMAPEPTVIRFPKPNVGPLPDTSRYGNVEKEFNAANERRELLSDLISSHSPNLEKDLQNEEFAKLFQSHQLKILAFAHDAWLAALEKKVKRPEHVKLLKLAKERTAALDRSKVGWREELYKALSEYATEHNINWNEFSRMGPSSDGPVIMARVRTMHKEFMARHYPDLGALYKESDTLTARVKDLMRMRLLRMAQMKRHFSVSGKVVDEHGNAITDATLQVAEGSYDSDTKITSVLPDGTFAIRLEDPFTQTYYLSVFKAGHHTMTMDPVKLKETESEHELAASKSLRNDLSEHVMRRPDITIVLYKIGKLAQLKKRRVSLSYNSDDSGKVLDLDKKTYPLEVDVAKLRDSKLLPKRAISFTAVFDKQGSFRSFSIRQGKPGRWEHPVVKYKLTMHDPDPTAGFWLVDPQKAGEHHRDDHMRQAPEAGYVRELVFGSKQEYQLGSFYIKSGGRYGKGAVGRHSYSQRSEPGRMSCEFTVEMQEDGSRNLETRYWIAIDPRLKYEPPNPLYFSSPTVGAASKK